MGHAFFISLLSLHNNAGVLECLPASYFRSFLLAAINPKSVFDNRGMRFNNKLLGVKILHISALFLVRSIDFCKTEAALLPHHY